MKKFSKLFALLLCVVMCVGCLTGCLGGVADIEIHPDGQVDAVARIGMTEEGIKLMNDNGMPPEMGSTPFEYNGITYYGDIENQHYDSIEAFNAEWSELSDMNTTEVMTLSRDGSGFKLVINAYKTTEFVSEYQDMFALESENAEEAAMAAELLKTMVYVLNFKFPYPVEIQSGATSAVVASGNSVSFDLMQMGNITNDVVIVSNNSVSAGSISEEDAKKKQEELERQRLEAEKLAELEKQKADLEKEIGRIIFDDVPDGAWYNAAVYALAESGLVKGVGAGKFDPNGTLTYAQFCQILANAEGLPTGEVNGYWAYKAIESCRNKGYIIDLGSYTPANYDVAMPREAAVAGMFRAKATELYTSGKVGNSIKLEDIPDYMFISDAYKNDIVDAYNSGLTNGVDDKRTFSPQLILSRAEVCQLFVNADFAK